MTVAQVILNCPNEVILDILRLLSPQDILKMRQTCSRIYFLTYDRSLWNHVTLRLSDVFALPSKVEIQTYSVSDLENIAIRADRVEKQWLLPRGMPPRRIGLSMAGQQGPIGYMKLFQNRYILIIYASSSVVLADVDGLHWHKTSQDASHGWGRVIGSWSNRDIGNTRQESCKARYDEVSQDLLVSFCLNVNFDSILHVLAISLSGNPAQVRPFRLKAHIHKPDPKNSGSPTCINKNCTWVAQGSYAPHGIEITSIATGAHAILISSQMEDDDTINPYAKWLTLDVFEPYIIAVRPEFFQIYIIPQDLETTLGSDASCVLTTVHTVHFPDRTFWSAAVSILPTPDLAFINDVSVILFLTDTFRTIMDYSIRVVFNPENGYSAVSSATHNEVVSLASRGSFINDGFSLGPLARRGAWIEKASDSLERRIIAFKRDCSQGDDPSVAFCQVYVTKSIDFADDLVRISCDEVTGRIIIATRRGELWILDTWHTAPAPDSRAILTRFRNPIS